MDTKAVKGGIKTQKRRVPQKREGDVLPDKYAIVSVPKLECTASKFAES